MNACCPVSPFLQRLQFDRTGPAGGGVVEELDEVVHEGEMVFNDPIVGKRPADETDAMPKALISPKEMSEKEFAEHCLTHIPYNPACQYCVAGKRNNVYHLRSPGGRKIPLVAADYGFLTIQSTDEVVPFICVYVKPWKVYFAAVVDVKGPNPLIVKRLARWFGELGLSHLAYRSDREPAIRVLLRAATIQAGLKAIDHSKRPQDEGLSGTAMPMADWDAKRNPPDDDDDVPVAVPEESMPGESRSNGLAERAVQSIEDKLRTTKTALEDRISSNIPCSHPIMAWMVEYVALLVAKYQPGEDGLTGYARLHGQNARERLPEFGETILFYVPVRSRGKMDPRWRFGTFLGRSWNSDQNFIGLADGSVTRAKGIARTVPSKKWQPRRLELLRATPWSEQSKNQDSIDELEHPSAMRKPAQKEQLGEDDAVQRRVPSAEKDLLRFGYTEGCPICNLFLVGDKARAHHSRHAEFCVRRIHDLLRKEGSSNILKGDKQGRAAPPMSTSSSSTATSSLQQTTSPPPLQQRQTKQLPRMLQRLQAPLEPRKKICYPTAMQSMSMQFCPIQVMLLCLLSFRCSALTMSTPAGSSPPS